MYPTQRAFSVLFVLAVLLWSCSKKEQSERQTVGAFSYETVQLEKVYGVCGQPDSSCASIKIEYPNVTQMSNDTVRAAINRYIREMILETSLQEEPAENMEALMEQFIQEYKVLLKDFPDYRTDWSSEKKTEILHQDGKVLSLRFTDFSYTGGAHPITLVSYSSFNLHTGRRLELADLFTPGFEETLNSIAEAKFRTDKQIDSAASLNSAGFIFENDRFSLPDNFAIVQEGIAFYYNHYEIAPYAMGATELVLPYEQLKKIISDKGISGVEEED